MQRTEAEKRAQFLRSEIEKHNYKYYVLDSPVISDSEFDALMDELIRLEREHPELATPDSPTRRVGGEPIKVFQQVRHGSPMLSLDNTYNKDELAEFDGRVRRLIPHERFDYVVELKIDGVASSLTYVDGRLSVAATRGDGTTGDDITHNAKTIKSIPLRVDNMPAELKGNRFDVRGEIFLPLKSFRKLNEDRLDKSEEPFANPRNAAAGSLKQLDPKVVAMRGLDIFVYSLVPEGDPTLLKTQEASFKALEEMGFKVNRYWKVFPDIDSVVDYCNEWENKRDDLDYEIDGMVVKVNQLELQEKLGKTGKSPRWAISYKFPAKQATTVVENIIASVGRTGTITPVAVLKPVPLGGVTISRATLHNADELGRLNIDIGDTVLLERGGEVIPKVVKVVQKGGGSVFKLPDKCPVCGGDAVREEGEAATRCINVGCPAQLQKNVEHYASRGGMDIEGLGPKVIALLIKEGKISDFADLYKLKVDEIEKLERMGKKSAENLVKEIEKSKGRPLDRLIFSLGIRHVGSNIAEILAKRYDTLYKLKDASLDDLKGMYKEKGQNTGKKAAGPKEADKDKWVIARSVHDFFKEPRNLAVIEKLKEAGVSMEEAREMPTAKQTLAGKTFVFTGAFSIPRPEAEAAVKALGGKATSSVSKNTDYVVAGAEPGSKYDKAKALGVKIITEEEFKELVGI